MGRVQSRFAMTNIKGASAHDRGSDSGLTVPRTVLRAVEAVEGRLRTQHRQVAVAGAVRPVGTAAGASGALDRWCVRSQRSARAMLSAPLMSRATG